MNELGEFILNGVIYLLLIFLASIPILLSLWGYKYLRKKGYGKVGIYLPIVASGLIIYLIIISIYPADRLFVRNFEKYTGYHFPESGSVIEKYESSDFDIHGDFDQYAIFKVDRHDYILVLNEIQQNTLFESYKDTDNPDIPLDTLKQDSSFLILKQFNRTKGEESFDLYFSSDSMRISYYLFVW